MTGSGSTGTVDYNAMSQDILSTIPAWVALDKVPIAKLDLKPSTWNGVTAIGDYTNGVRFPDSAGVNMSGYGSTIVGVNAGRVADVGDPSD